MKHGAPPKRKCTHEGCNNGVIRAGVCWTHGARHHYGTGKRDDNISGSTATDDDLSYPSTEDNSCHESNGGDSDGSSPSAKDNTSKKASDSLINRAGNNMETTSGSTAMDENDASLPPAKDNHPNKRRICLHPSCTKWAQTGEVCLAHLICIPAQDDGADKQKSNNDDEEHSKIIAIPPLSENKKLGLVVDFSKESHGALIKRILPDCTFKDEVQVGDRIVTNDGQKVNKSDDLRTGSDRVRQFGIIRSSVAVGSGAKRQCKHSGCSKPALVGGACLIHFKPKSLPKCNFEGCTNNAQRRGFCKRHREEKESSHASNGVDWDGLAPPAEESPPKKRQITKRRDTSDA